MRSMFSMDGKQWIYGDAFGVTRLDLGKALKVSKHTYKGTNPTGAISMSLDGKLGAAAPARYQTGVYGNDGLITFGLPALGLKAKIIHFAPAGLFSSPAGDRIATFSGMSLRICGIANDRLVDERVVDTDRAPDLGKLKLGPAFEPRQRDSGAAEPLLRIYPDGRYVLLTNLYQLVAGKLSDAAYNDEEWWQLSLIADPWCQTSLEIVGEDVWVSVMDPAHDKAHVARITRTGEVTTYELDSLCAPAVSAGHILYQPSSAEVRRRELGTGQEQVFDVSAHLTHPHEDHGDEVYKGSPRPPKPTRLPGHLAMSDKYMFFVPWHGEVVVELGAGLTLDRKLEAAPGPFRRLVQEIIARNNEALRQVPCQVQLHGFDHVPQRRTSSLQLKLPRLTGSFIGLVASYIGFSLSDRYELRANNWGWGSMSQHGGAHSLNEPYGVAQVRRALGLMRSVDMVPFDVTGPVADLYSRRMGIPHDYNASEEELRGGEAERLHLRAMLETIKAQGWPDGPIPDAWAKEPVTTQLALDAIEGLHGWPRSVPYHGLQLLSMMLASHLGPDAQPVLLKLAADFPEPLNWQQYRNAGECLVWLCRRHPALKDQTLAAWTAIHHPSGQFASWDGEKETVRAALERGAKHLWSNG